MPHSRRSRLSMLALACLLGLAPVSAVRAQDAGEGDAGAYLAARTAARNADYLASAEWHSRALLDDPGNSLLLEGAIIANIAIGEFGPAQTLALALQEQEGKRSEIVHVTLLAHAAQAGDHDEILAQTQPGVDEKAILDTLLAGWAQFGQGRMTDAAATFDILAKEEGAAAFGLYHKALALALAGDFGGADKVLSGQPGDGALPLSRRGVIAHAQILSQLERNADALAVLDRYIPGEQDAGVLDLKRRLTAGEPVPFDTLRTPADGMAEAFFDLAGALGGEEQATAALAYARFAQAIRPDHIEASLLTAELLESQGQHELATQAYAEVPADSPVFHIAEVGRAEATYAAGRKEAALEILQALARSHADQPGVHLALADMLRRDEHFAEARSAYDAAIARLGPDQFGHWVAYFSRGICAERLGDFAGAEADMRKALALNPDEPRVLNYLGYSFVDRGEKLVEALKMIETAVAREPGSGYIIDSLAWAYYRLGRYADAVEPMERASLLEPVDPIVTDHLGDVYWAVGRTREAEFQWHRALSYGPEEKDAARIRAKLEKGLDAVLAEEGARPIAPVEAKAND